MTEIAVLIVLNLAMAAAVLLGAFVAAVYAIRRGSADTSEDNRDR